MTPAPATSPETAGPSAARAATTVLVVDDNPVDRRLAGGLVEKIRGWKAVYASNGAEGLAAVERDKPEMVLTDLLMPEMDGLALVEAMRTAHPAIPVVLMTALGSEDVAMKALHAGAASYIPKRNLAADLGETLRRILAAASRVHQEQRLLDCLLRAESTFALDNDAALVPTLVAHLQEYLAYLRLGDEGTRLRVGIALEEVVHNAIYHGNLEVGSELRRHDDQAYHRLADERRLAPPYRDRRVLVEARLSRGEALFVVRDEGPGFDPATLPDPTDPANLDKPSGRGLLLVRTFMDEVRFGGRGNQVTLVKRQAPAAAGAA
jgi:CheY-like chemotaxis protein